MDILLAIVAAALIVALLLWGVRSARLTTSTPATGGGSFIEDGRATVTLDIGDVDPDSAAVERMVDDIAGRVFASVPDAGEVEVRNESGRVIGQRRRELPRAVEIPDDLYEPHLPRHVGPDPRERLAETAGSSARPGVNREARPGTVPTRPLADRFELPETVRSRVEDADDPVSLVRAILEAGGRHVDADREVLRSGDEAVIVIRAPIGEPVPGDALSRAYRRFQESGARRGVVVTPGYADPADVRRREVLVPALLHAGPEGIQRMADAVELGADPTRFAAGPALRA